MRYSSLLLTASIAVFLNACSTAELAVDLAKNISVNKMNDSLGTVNPGR